jgi:tripartite-type tricarboxylate transporter receptor subunit TctC
MISRQHLTRLTLSVSLSIAAFFYTFGIHSAYAQEYPTRPITLLVGFSAGGPTDSAARAVAEQMSKQLGQQVVISNKPGVGGLLAAREMMASKPDGYTLFLASNSFFSHGPARYESVSYDYDRDFTPVGGVSGYPHVLIVAADSKFNNAQELFAYAKNNPGKLNAASVGFGNEIALTWMSSLGKMNLTQIPYKGAAAVINDLSAGRVDLALVAPSVAYPLIDSSRAKGLATTRKTPITETRKLVSVSEAGLTGFDFYVWNGIVAPANTPKPILEKLGSALQVALKQEPLLRQFATAFLNAEPMTDKQLTEAFRTELATSKKVLKDANIPMLKQP